jgi:UDP-N-acetylmuramoyl-tripeptide--D-alanyl-D-alanine ligase
MRRTVAELATLLGVAVQGMPATVVTGAAIDSRLVRPGDLFVALPGEHVDGHEFVGDALRHGAAAALVARPLKADLPQLVVRNTTAALQTIAAAERAAAAYRLVAVTGSIAKTTTKDFLAALMATTYRVGATRGSRNSQAGFPAELCSQDEDIEWMVAELGMNRAGELDRLGAIARPDALLYTLVAPVHLEYFPSIDAIAEAKAELIPHLRRDGLLVLNSADARVASLARRFPGRCELYGSPGTSALWIERYESRGLLGGRIVLAGRHGTIEVDCALAGRHQADNLLAAACCALALGVEASGVAAAASALRPPSRRGELYGLACGVTVVDDSYNASPEAVLRLLDLLASTSGRKVAVLGEMLELGPTAVAFHRRVGDRAGCIADVVIAVGGEPAAALAAAAGGLHVADAEAALATLRPLLRPGDVVLVKGSRAIGLDRLVDALREGGD